MPASVIVWDIETVPGAYRGSSPYSTTPGTMSGIFLAHAEMSDKFPKLIYHSIVCIAPMD